MSLKNKAPPTNTTPQKTVNKRENKSSLAGDKDFLGKKRSYMEEEANELSELLNVDMAAAKTDAMIKPDKPTGMDCMINRGKISSERMEAPW